ncbi:MAG TPA: hypothetical protein VFR31_05410 [Thermoanaerobaculia bacterium]|nr:hypothetical protein [Thermoanaerobaculia bacterium]
MHRCLWLLLLVALPVQARESDRTVEVVRYGCANEVGHREVTLFRNGTVRLFDGPPGEELMGLAELSPDELTAFLNRLGAEDLSEARHMHKGIEGPFIEKCELHLQLPDQKPEVFRFGRYDALPLNLSRLLRVIEDIAAMVEDLKGVEELPVAYVPRVYDVLKRKDGQRYKIMRFTSDDKGVELLGIDQPIFLIVLREEMRKEFVALLSREGSREK